ncbi:unnamed protein product [Closterium sp. Yama58-4]|nr:unnamed protein product [Closterium sp. Yama58-4]
MPRILRQLPLLRSSSKEERGAPLERPKTALPSAIPACSSVGPAPSHVSSLLERKTSLPSFLPRKSSVEQPRKSLAEQRPAERPLREGTPALRPKSPHHLEWVRQLSLWQGAQAQQGEAQAQARGDAEGRPAAQGAEVPRNGQLNASQGKARGEAHGSAQDARKGGARKDDARTGHVSRRKQFVKRITSRTADAYCLPEAPLQDVWEAAEAGRLAVWVDQTDGGDEKGIESDGRDALQQNGFVAGMEGQSQQACQFSVTVSVNGVSNLSGADVAANLAAAELAAAEGDTSAASDLSPADAVAAGIVASAFFTRKSHTMRNRMVPLTTMAVTTPRAPGTAAAVATPGRKGGRGKGRRGGRPPTPSTGAAAVVRGGRSGAGAGISPGGGRAGAGAGISPGGGPGGGRAGAGAGISPGGGPGGGRSCAGAAGISPGGGRAGAGSSRRQPADVVSPGGVATQGELQEPSFEMPIQHHPPEVLFIEQPAPRSQAVESMVRMAERAQVLPGGGATGRAQVLSLEVPSPGPSPGPSCGMDWEGMEIGEGEGAEEGEEEIGEEGITEGKYSFSWERGEFREEGWGGEEGGVEGSGEWREEGWEGWRREKGVGRGGEEEEGEDEEEEEEGEQGEEGEEEDDAEFCSPTWREWHASAFLEEGELGEGIGVGEDMGLGEGGGAREADGARQCGAQGDGRQGDAGEDEYYIAFSQVLTPFSLALFSQSVRLSSPLPPRFSPPLHHYSLFAPPSTTTPFSPPLHHYSLFAPPPPLLPFRPPSTTTPFSPPLHHYSLFAPPPPLLPFRPPSTTTPFSPPLHHYSLFAPPPPLLPFPPTFPSPPEHPLRSGPYLSCLLSRLKSHYVPLPSGTSPAIRPLFVESSASSFPSPLPNRPLFPHFPPSLSPSPLPSPPPPFPLPLPPSLFPAPLPLPFSPSPFPSPFPLHLSSPHFPSSFPIPTLPLPAPRSSYLTIPCRPLSAGSSASPIPNHRRDFSYIQ